MCVTIVLVVLVINIPYINRPYIIDTVRKPSYKNEPHKKLEPTFSGDI